MKKRLPRINVVLAIASLIVAILTWLFPFGPAGPSPFSFKPSPPTQDTATLVTVSSFTLTPYYTNTQTLPVYTTITFTPTAALAESGTLPTALTAGPRPGTYTMQTGEFINCIARRFNVDFYELLALNGLFDSQTVYPGLVLKIPQSGKAFPGNRILKTHPATYTVTSSSETIYSVACEFGDIDPSAIAQANGLSVGAALTSGQQLNIP